MGTLKEICLSLDELLQPALFNDFCTNGLQVEGKEKVNFVCVAVSASLNVINEAVKLGADVLLVHHGIFWNRDSHDITGVTKKKLKLLLENDISLLAYHLPLDAHKVYGNNWKAALDMGWTDLASFPAGDKQPIGVKGKVPAQNFEAFIEKLKGYYKSNVEFVAGGPREIKTAALVSGGAHKMILDAAREEVDCFITGSRDEPTWHQSFENAVNFCAVGHAPSEEIGVHALEEFLQTKLKVKTHFIKETNPF
ncbi:MAG: Nif3-like dinuclear metal center hexameric protein [Parachlamydiales bacterium]|jgi:dinuclear metal center YbgI/SA1388 family protein